MSVTLTTVTHSNMDLVQMSSSREQTLAPDISNNDIPPEDAAYSTTAIPDGGRQAWTIVICAAVTIFWSNGIINCWGVLQAALLSSTLQHVSTSTLSFVGSLGLAGSAFCGIFVVRLMRYIDCHIMSTIGVALMGIGLITSSFCTHNVVGLFFTTGVISAVGMAMVYTVSNTLPVQYFSGHLGLANGIVKLGGGIGGCVLAVSLEALNQRVGIAWTFRIQGLLTLAIGFPAAWQLKNRVEMRHVPLLDLSMFRSLPFVLVFFAGAIGTFALFIPPYFLPLVAQSINLSPSTGAALVAAFNLCNAIGRFIAGPLCDRIGPINTFLLTMVFNAVSMLAIWPVSDSLPPLMIFAIVNGIANGSFFTTLPTVVAGMFGPGRAAVAMSMSVAGWSAGYLLGAPIAGYLLSAGGGEKDGSGKGSSTGRDGIEIYRPAIFYAGGVAMASAVIVVIARSLTSKQVLKKV